MRGKKKYYLAAAILILAGACQIGGCRKVTAVSLMKDSGSYIAKANSFEGTMKADLAMEAEQSGMSLGMDVNINLDIEAINEPMAIYMDGSMDLGIMGMKMDTETYVVREGDTIVTYSKMADTWTKEEMPYQENDKQGLDTKKLGALLAGFAAEKLTLQDGTEKAGEREVYVLTIDLEKEDLEAIMNMMGDVWQENAGQDLDLEDLKVKMTYKVDKKTKAPVEITLSIPEGLDDLINGLLDTMGAGVQMSVNQCEYTIAFDSFGTVDKITVPQEVKDQAREKSDVPGIDDLGIDDRKASI